MRTKPGSILLSAAKSLRWVSITSGSSGTGNGTVSYSVSKNTTKATRTGNITNHSRQDLCDYAEEMSY